ncbi:MAG: hypothetical protein Q8934_11545 [Bacillota bacterium]|nr:hypothetical protein [Bacillota bacterium]
MDQEAETKWNKGKLVLFIFCTAISLCLVSSCSAVQNYSASIKHVHLQKKKAVNKWKLPMSIPEGEFFEASGWLTSNQILFITNKEQTSNLYSYDLITGKNILLFHSNAPIVTVDVSPEKKYILIHSSPSTDKGDVTIIDQKGSKVWNLSIPSFELDFEWNPYNESQMVVTKFNEDWTFQVYQLDIAKKGFEPLLVPQPFIEWMSRNTIAYLNLDQNHQSLFGPLIKSHLSPLDGQMIFQKVYQFSAFKNLLMTITVNDQDKTKAIYSFFDSKLNSVMSFSIPQLTKYSDWLVPFYDFNTAKNQFITFRPLRSTSFDSYTEGFQLVSYGMKSGKSEILFKDLENSPIISSPSGNACLYGNRLEKIIDFKNKKIFSLLKE